TNANRRRIHCGREPRLRCEDGAMAPTVQQIFPPSVETLGKWQFVGIAENEAIPDVELRVRPIKGNGLARIDEGRAVVYEHTESIGSVVQAVSPGVVGIESQAIVKAADGL